MTEEVQHLGINLFKNTHVKEVTKGADGLLTVSTKEGETVGGVDCLLWAVGRTPATAELDLASAGVEADHRGNIKVDEFQNTSTENVYALGDVTGKWELTPGEKRMRYSHILLDDLNICFSSCDRCRAQALPPPLRREEGLEARLREHPHRRLLSPAHRCMKTRHPTRNPFFCKSLLSLGTVGITEQDARKRFGDDNVKVYKTRFTALYHALTERKQPTQMKLVCAGENEKVVGLHMIGRGCDEMLQVRRK